MKMRPFLVVDRANGGVEPSPVACSELWSVVLFQRQLLLTLSLRKSVRGTRRSSSG